MSEITYTFEYPIAREQGELKTVALRRPLAGELRGLKLTELLQMDVASAEKLLPRISELSAIDIAKLDPVDLTGLMSEVLNFFLPKASLSMT